MPLNRLIAPPLLALSATAAWAQDDAMCRNGLFPEEPPFALASVNGKDSAYFHDDLDGCPWKEGDCSQEAYVVPGDIVIVSKIRKGFACAFYPSKGGGTAGWIATRRLDLQPIETNPPLSAWVGDWSSEGNPEVTFTVRLGQLHVSGDAFWPGPQATTDWPSIHEGAIDGTVDRKGHRGDYSDDDLCEVQFTLLGDFLLAGDNHHCGGMNVSFSAVYQRKTN